MPVRNLNSFNTYDFFQKSNHEICIDNKQNLLLKLTCFPINKATAFITNDTFRDNIYSHLNSLEYSTGIHFKLTDIVNLSDMYQIVQNEIGLDYPTSCRISLNHVIYSFKYENNVLINCNSKISTEVFGFDDLKKILTDTFKKTMDMQFTLKKIRKSNPFKILNLLTHHNVYFFQIHNFVKLKSIIKKFDENKFEKFYYDPETDNIVERVSNSLVNLGMVQKVNTSSFWCDIFQFNIDKLYMKDMSNATLEDKLYRLKSIHRQTLKIINKNISLNEENFRNCIVYLRSINKIDDLENNILKRTLSQI
jgi:hypothetical protein